MSYGVCPECKDSNITIENVLNKKKGYCYLLRLHCRSCLWEKTTYSSNARKKKQQRRGKKIYEVNTRMAVAFREFGRGHSAMKIFSQCMNMLSPMSLTSYNLKVNRDSYISVANFSMRKVVQETRKILLKGKDSDEPVNCQASLQFSSILFHTISVI